MYHYVIVINSHPGITVTDSDIAEDCTMASKPVKDEIDLDDNKPWKEFEDRDLAPGVNIKKSRKEFNVQSKINVTGTMGTGKTLLASAMIGSYICEVGVSQFLFSQDQAFMRKIRNLATCENYPLCTAVDKLLNRTKLWRIVTQDTI